MWKDISSFSQRATNRVPRTFEFKAAGIRVVVSRHHDYPDDVWTASAEPYFSLLELKNTDIADAKTEAINIVKNCLAKTLAALDA
jgi:uncharacterized protein with FMN-binding domain